MRELVHQVGALLPPKVKMHLAPVVSEFLRYRDYRAAMRGQIATESDIARRLKHSFHKISCPVILISQVQRSGGSLLSQLFDGHSQILAHPHELKIGYPQKDNWPLIDSGLSPEKQFKTLFELATIQFCRSGYAKGTADRSRKNFFFLPKIQRELFKTTLEQGGSNYQRHVLNSYFTSYFNAWLNLRSVIPHARYISAFVPMMASRQENMTHFWNTYPDGYLLSVIRSPLQWYPSAKRLADGRKLGDIEVAVERWTASTRAAIREKARHGDRVVLIHFDDLISNTGAVMGKVCKQIGLPYENILERPTFNTEPMGANTSFEKLEVGKVSNAPLERARHLSEEERVRIEEQCMELYESAKAHTLEIPACQLT